MCSAHDAAGNPSSSTFKVTVRDTTAPAVTPPASITIAATQAGGATASGSLVLAAFVAGGSAADAVDASPLRLPAQAGGLDVTNATLFPVGTTMVMFRFRDGSGNIGTAAANVTVIVGQPRLSGTVTGKGVAPSGAYYVDLRLSNSGTGNARNITVTQLPLRTLSGTGTVTYNAALSSPLPLQVASLDVGAATTIDITAVPEPTSLGLLGIGCAMLALRKKLSK